MSPKKLSKLELAKQKAHAGQVQIEKVDSRVFHDDVLKHHIRVYHWKKRIEKLLRAREISTVSYFSLCADTAYDVRFFKNSGLINFSSERPTPFAYCEHHEESFRFLGDVYKAPCVGFLGEIEEIASDPTNDLYGKFWGTFPYDVINLDFWGDIHKVKHSINNVFYAINAIVSQQALLRKPYELWITWRAKDDRVGYNVESEYQDIIRYNLKSNQSFAQHFAQKFQKIKDPKDLELEELVNIGFLKWLLYVTNRSFSVLENCDTLLYTRNDKDKKPYHLINFLLRIKPFEDVVIPSPASKAAIFCNDKYQKNSSLCFNPPIDVDREFASLARVERKKLEDGIKALKQEYIRDKAGFMR